MEDGQRCSDNTVDTWTRKRRLLMKVERQKEGRKQGKMLGHEGTRWQRKKGIKSNSGRELKPHEEGARGEEKRGEIWNLALRKPTVINTTPHVRLPSLPLPPPLTLISCPCLSSLPSPEGFSHNQLITTALIASAPERLPWHTIITLSLSAFTSTSKHFPVG